MKNHLANSTPGTRAWRTFYLPMFFLAWMGCAKPPPDFHIKLEAPGAAFFQKYRLTINGVDTEPLDSTKPYEFTAHGRPGQTPREMMPSMEASVLFVCGWQKAGLELHPPSTSEVEGAQKSRKTVSSYAYVDFPPPSWAQVAVLVDNRDGPAIKLTVGAYEQEVAAGGSGRLTFPYWSNCPEAQELRMNGELIGEFEADPRGNGGMLPLLLDTSGERCYRLEQHTYSTSPMPGGGRSQTTLPAQKLRTLKSTVDYFLQPLPSVEYSRDPVAMKSSLNEVPCNTPPRAKAARVGDPVSTPPRAKAARAGDPVSTPPRAKAARVGDPVAKKSASR